MKTENKFDCPKCSSTFYMKGQAVQHLQEEHGMTRPEAEKLLRNGEKDEEKDRDSETEKEATVKQLPVNRDYNWEDRIPENVPEYKPTKQEFRKIMADIENSKETGQLPRYLISGETGTGKTHLAKKLAETLNAPIFTIQGKYSLDESSLLGSPVLVNGETIWTDGTLTKALLASKDRRVILLLDEVNRVRPESKGVLFSALDDRCQVELDARGGETIQGNPQNLVVVSTINEGRDYKTQEIDKAEKRRLGTKFEVQYLGLNDRETEAEVIADRTPCGIELADLMVRSANEIRNVSQDSESAVQDGIPTSNLLDWSRMAYSYAEAGIENPVIEAAEDSVVRPIFERKVARENAMQTIKDYMDGVPFDEEEVKDYKEDPIKFDETTCSVCGRTFESKRGLSLHQSQSECGDKLEE